MNRRDFIQKTLLGGALLATGQFPFESFAAAEDRLTILHTNDTHSWLDPFPMSDKKYPGQGGVEARAALINKIRATEKNVLLFDAGDVFQGTPYFNIFKGEAEIKALSLMGYDAITMGNHDFDAGVDGFEKQLIHANFPVLTANYDFSKTALAGKTQPFKIFKKGNLKIGVFGLGIQLYGLVPREAFGDTKYLEPIEIARSMSKMLRKKGCNMVICLSHLGYSYKYEKPSDIVLARETEEIDLIIGGHTHTFLEHPTIVQNKNGKDVLINQVGWAGLRLGRIDFIFNEQKTIKMLKSNTVIISK